MGAHKEKADGQKDNLVNLRLENRLVECWNSKQSEDVRVRSAPPVLLKRLWDEQVWSCSFQRLKIRGEIGPRDGSAGRPESFKAIRELCGTAIVQVDQGEEIEEEEEEEEAEG
ncbi:hypothetical protein PAMA_009439 [Pampus argenteus]